MPESKGERISKRMSALGLCSRRDAERWIEAGRVAVNGKTIDTPVTLVTAEDIISVDGTEVKAAAPRPRMWRYYKPLGLVVTHRDPEGRPTVFDALPKDLPRVISVGRLDVNSEGLLLLTTSGELSRALELPKNALQRVYRVRVKGKLVYSQIHDLAKGIAVEGVDYQPIIVEPDNSKTEGLNHWYRVTLSEGKNREIRRVFEHFGLSVNRLLRVRYGHFELADMKPGEVAPVPGWQVETLIKKLGAL